MSVYKIKKLNERIMMLKREAEKEYGSIQEQEELVEFAYEYRDVLPIDYIIDHRDES